MKSGSIALEETAGNIYRGPSLLALVGIVSGAMLITFGSVLLIISANSSSSNDELGSGMKFTFRHIDYDVINYFDTSTASTISYKFLESYMGVIEPYAEMAISAYDMSAFQDSAVWFTFEICRHGSADSCQNGKFEEVEGDVTSETFSFDCSPFEEFDVSIRGYSSVDDTQVSMDTGSAICMYVRREVRTMTQSHIDQFLDAQYVMTAISQEEGEALYGSDYYSAKELTRLHLYNAGQIDADHLHDGNGFLPNHIKLQYEFEKSLLAIDPSVVLPYWDFTIDAGESYAAHHSPIISAMYGNTSDAADGEWYEFAGDSVESARILDGRWANLKSETNDLPTFDYGYGYMRAAWAMNPSPYISRYVSSTNTYPTCSDHYDTLSTSFDALMDFLYKIAFRPHGPAHIVLGGIYGCDVLDPAYLHGKLIGDKSITCVFLQFKLKVWVRYGYWTPKTDCTLNSTDYSESRCGFTCDAAYKHEMVADMYDKFGSLMTGSYDDSFVDYWHHLLCKTDLQNLFSGDHLEAASAADPSFWILHPVVDRLYQARMMLGGFDDVTWETDAVNDYVCDFPSCIDVATGEFGYWDSCCYGHYENDQLMNYNTATQQVEYLGMTNAEALAATDPRSMSYSMPYIYDHFTWEHCDEDFASLFA